MAIRSGSIAIGCFFYMEASRIRYWLGVLFVFLAAFCFALKGVLIKLAYQYHIDALSLLTLRLLFALPFYVGIALYQQQRTPVAPLTVREWLWLFFLGVTGYYLASYFNFIGLVYISASLERILLFTYPTFVLLMNAVTKKRSISRLQWGALALTYLGILIAFAPHIQFGDHHAVLLGAFWVILSGLVYAVYLVGSDSMIARVGSQRYTCYALIAATIPVVIHCLSQNGFALTGYPVPIYALTAIMAVFVTVVPTFMIAEGIKRVGSANASLVASIGPVFTIVLASVLLGEKITALQLLGTAFVLAGVSLIGWRGKKI